MALIFCYYFIHSGIWSIFSMARHLTLLKNFWETRKVSSFSFSFIESISQIQLLEYKNHFLCTWWFCPFITSHDLILLETLDLADFWNIVIPMVFIHVITERDSCETIQDFSALRLRNELCLICKVPVKKIRRWMYLRPFLNHINLKED